MTTGYRERPDRDGCRDRGDRDDRRDRGDPREGREGEGPVGVGPPRDRDTLRTPIKGLLIGRVFFFRFFGLSWETSPQTDLTPEASTHSGSGRIEFSSKSTTFLM